MSLLHFDRFSKFFHCHTLWTTCDKTVTKDFTTPKKASLHYLVKYKFSKTAPADAQQWQTKHT